MRERPLSLLDSARDFRGGLTSILALRLYGEFRQADEFSPLAVEGLVLEIMAEASRSAAESSSCSKPRWLEQAREILHDGCGEAPTLSHLAAAVGVHPIYLARSFRKHYRCTVGEYVRRLRIEAACREISVSRKPLSEIAAASGFCDQSHFSNAFKRYTGMTPAEFRAVSLRSG
jgi:AraC family transcriptional regulator